MTRLAEGVEQTYARKLQSVLGAAFDFVLLEFLQPGIHNLPILLSNTGQVLLTIWFRRLKISSGFFGCLFSTGRDTESRRIGITHFAQHTFKHGPKLSDFRPRLR